jgi:hypothetical protein
MPGARVHDPFVTSGDVARQKVGVDGSPAGEAAGAPGRKAAGQVGGGFRVTQPGYHPAGVQPRRAGPEMLRLIRIWTAQHYLPDPADRALAVAAGHQGIMT